MKLVMDEQQYQELEDLIEIFKGMFFDKEEVQCFSFIKDIVDREYDTNDIPKEKKEKISCILVFGKVSDIPFGAGCRGAGLVLFRRLCTDSERIAEGSKGICAFFQ